MKLTETIKTAIIAIGLSTATVSATEQVKEECTILIYDKDYNCHKEGNNTVCDIKSINKRNGIWDKIGEFTVETKNGEVKVYIPESDSQVSINKLINNGNGNCKIGKKKIL